LIKTELANYLAVWQLKAIRNGDVLVDQPVTGFSAMRTALATCAAKTNRAVITR